jgi:hypothetical protein
MRKIPTIFQRDPRNLRSLLPNVTPGCEWVIAGEGVATRKYDGTCVMLDENGLWWARREVRDGNPEPAFYIMLEHDRNTGKSVGWEPVRQSGFARWHESALGNMRHIDFQPGTYELVGPKVNGNPEGLVEHRLIPHTQADRIILNLPHTFESIRDAVTSLDFEGIVWHHPDGRMGKIKRRDFR